MYYYIFDPPGASEDYEVIAKVKAKLSALGIAGEMTSPSPGRGVPELVENALAKRYSTIVAVGGMSLINQIAQIIESLDFVMGIIPIKDNPDIQKLIGATDWESAVDQLKRRRYVSLRMGVINRTECFLTPAVINLPANNTLSIKTKHFEAKADVSKVTITPEKSEEHSSNLIIEMDSEPIKSKKGFFSSLFTKEQKTNPTYSRLFLPQVELTTNLPAKVEVAGVVMAETPIQVEVSSRPIKLIVGSKHL